MTKNGRFGALSRSGLSKKLWVILSVKPRTPASIFWTLAVTNLQCFWLVEWPG